MKKKRVKPNVINVMADGRVIPDAEFMAQPYVVVAEDNYDFHVKCNRVFDPNHYVKEALRRKYILAEQRRAELEAQQAEIASQLSRL